MTDSARDQTASTHVLAPPRYAGFWRRLAALLVDALILYTIFALVTWPLALIYAWTFHVAEYEAGKAIGYLFGPVLMVGPFLYWSLMESSARQASVGKMLLGIVVTDLHGRRLSRKRALGRNLGKIISVFFFGIGYVLLVFTARKQALHDLIADCLVLRREHDAPASPVGAGA